MFQRLLIANRGEIACRVIRTAKRLGIRTIAIYSDADRNARHVVLADEAVPVGPAPARDSYLHIDAVIAAARQAKADSIHPGYGFLSENAAFAEACAAAGIVFVGPPPAAIRAMGDKSAAKALMEKAGVPTVPGFHGAQQDLKTFAVAASRIGYPVLIKASAGGGGKGMRIVESEDDLEDAMAGARREAASSFGDDKLLIEKYLLQPRHIEIQVFADSHGNAVHLFERDCSIQRRHQKVIEEAPAPGLPEATRRTMGEAAVKAARAVDYRGAGTIEFIVDRDGKFYFMEMNTRLQVEHPVTEMITGQDLVEWQLVVADGGKLLRRQDELKISGHALEARLYAEDPARDFLPASGAIDHLVFPDESPALRVETGVRQGDTISIHYDPMIAKLVVWGQDRAEAVDALKAALARCEIVGPPTNRNFLAAIAAHPAFGRAELDTGFIARHMDTLVPKQVPAPARIIALAALALILDARANTTRAARRSADPFTPWAAVNGWRLNDAAAHGIVMREGAAETTVSIQFRMGGFAIVVADKAFLTSGTLDDRRLTGELDGESFEVAVVRRDDRLTLIEAGSNFSFVVVDPTRGRDAAAADIGKLTAPMPGKIVAVRVKNGATVKRGTPLLILEAMKMEHTIKAPADGIVERVRYKVGEQVDEGVELVVFKAAG